MAACQWNQHSEQCAARNESFQRVPGSQEPEGHSVSIASATPSGTGSYGERNGFRSDARVVGDSRPAVGPDRRGLPSGRPLGLAVRSAHYCARGEFLRR